MEELTGELTAGAIVTAWAIIQTFGLEYLWFVKDWFDSLEVGKKKTVNAIGVFAVTLIAFLLSVFVEGIEWFTLDVFGVASALFIFLGALGIGQGVHSGTKRTK
jgi:hypothetical protein